MATRVLALCLLLTGCVLGVAFWPSKQVQGATAAVPATWDRVSAASYLDQREIWWQQWPRAQKDHGTVCISCHTNVPYAMARPGLQRELAETAEPAPEKAMLDSVEKRVSQWPEMETFYTDAKSGPGKTVESRATEAVLNAIILAGQDAQLAQLRPITRTAFDNAWALQENSGDLAGAWKWQNFHLGPWEGEESGYQGAALLLLEALKASGGYAKEPAVRTHLDRLRDYLRRQYAAQPLVNRLYVLWASPKEPGLLTRTQKKDLLSALEAQQQTDGGWRTAALDQRERKDHSPAPTASDGYATGLAVLALEDAGLGHHDPTLSRGLAWLAANQQKDGTWSAASINKLRDPKTDAAPFMTDAATAYAVLALQNARRR